MDKVKLRTENIYISVKVTLKYSSGKRKQTKELAEDIISMACDGSGCKGKDVQILCKGEIRKRGKDANRG